MKSLYETILSSTKSGQSEYIRILFDTPDKNEVLNKEWKNLSLGLDLGEGEGFWRYDKNTKTYFYRVTVELPKHDIQTFNAALYNLEHVYHSDIIVSLPYDIPRKRVLTKWAEKISRILKMEISYDKNNIGLKFV